MFNSEEKHMSVGGDGCLSSILTTQFSKNIANVKFDCRLRNLKFMSNLLVRDWITKLQYVVNTK